MNSPLVALVFCILLNLVSPSPLFGQTPSRTEKLSFQGKLLSINLEARSLTIAGKNPLTLHWTTTTKMTDAHGTPATLAAASVGKEVSGRYSKDTNGRLILHSVQFGTKTSAENPDAASTLMPATSPVITPLPSLPPNASTMETTPAGKARMSAHPSATPREQRLAGRVVSLTQNTLVVHGKTSERFTLTPSTYITDATGSPMQPGDLTPGAHVVGSYVQHKNGVRMIRTLKIIREE